MDASAMPPSPRSCATPTTSPTASTCAGHPVRARASPRRVFDEATHRWIDRDRPRRHGHRRSSASWRPAACRRPSCRSSRASTVPRASVPHRPLAARGRRLHRQAGRRDRHRLVGDPVDPDDRRAGRAPRPSSSARRTSASRRATHRWTPRYERRDEGRLRRAPRRRRSSRAPASLCAAERSRRCEVDRRRSAQRVRGALGARRHRLHARPSTTCSSNKEANDTAAEFVRDKIREIVRDPEVAETLCPALPDRHQAASASTPTTTRPSTATTSRWSTSRTTPIEEITPTRLRTSGRRVRVRRHRVRHRLRRDDRRAARASTSAAAGGRSAARKVGRTARAPTSA